MKIVLTGATRGIGRAAARELARQGHELVVVARDQARADGLLSELSEAGDQVKAEALLCDLSSQVEIRRLAVELRAKHPQFDVLINNAGGVFPTRKVTVDGYEWTFAVNHLAYFLLTALVRDLVQQRIVSVSSGAHTRGRMRFDDLMGERRYRSFDAYTQSKLANILFTRELAHRLPAGVTANCMHPGFVDSGFGHHEGGIYDFGLKLLRPFMLSAEEGADTLVWLATSPEVAQVSGEYFFKRKQRHGSSASRDPETAKKLWEVSEKLTGLAS